MEADLQIKQALRYADEAGQPALSILPLYESGALLWKLVTQSKHAPIRKILKTK